MYPLTVRHHNVLSIRFTTVRKKIFVPRQILEYGRTWIERRKEGREGGRHLHRNGIVTVSLSLHRGSKKPALLSGSSQVLTSNELQGKTACLSFYIIKNPMIYQRQSTEPEVFLNKRVRETRQTAGANSRRSATKKHEISRTLLSINLHFSVQQHINGMPSNFRGSEIRHNQSVQSPSIRLVSVLCRKTVYQQLPGRSGSNLSHRFSAQHVVT